MFVPHSFRAAVASLALASLVASVRAHPIQAIRPDPLAPAPTALGASASLAASAGIGDTQADALTRELLAGLPDVVAVRLDPLGNPIARLDLFFGGPPPIDEVALYALLEQFDFGEGSGLKDPVETREDVRWRNVLLPPTSAPTGLPDVTFFDSTRDLAVAIRRLENATALSCSGAFAVNFNGFGSTGQSFYFYVSADMIAGAVGPNVSSITDPDLYLYYWNGSAWATLGWSISSTAIDSVGAYNSGCFNNSFRVRVHMYRGGSFGVRVHRFFAS